jgi:hypothetical protein
VIKIFAVVVFGFLTFFVAGGVVFTVNEHLPAFRPFTTPDLDTEQIFFDAGLTVVTIFDLGTTVLPRVFSAESTVTVLPFFTDTTLGAATAGVATPGVVPPPPPIAVEPLVVALKAPPPVPTDIGKVEANCQTPSERTLKTPTLSPDAGGSSTSATAPVSRPFELSLIESASVVSSVT